MNLIFHALIFKCIFYSVYCEEFDRYSAQKVEHAIEKELRSKNATEICSISVKPCAPHEGSRIDGTCNNFKHPAAGSAKGPYLRLLEPDYGHDKKGIRKDKNGAPLPSARKVRTTLQSTGRVVDKHDFTIALPHYLEFIRRDVSLLNGPRDYLRKRQYCCTPEGSQDERCIPISVPDDDPYLKVTDIRCLNFSRAETFQDVGCTTEIIPPEQINFQTPVIDLSTIYGTNETALDSVREYEHGLLKLERRLTRFVPLNISNPTNITDLATNITQTLMLPDSVSMAVMDLAQNLSSSDVCLQNLPNETICYKFGFPEAGNFNIRTTTLAIFFMREHNRLAKELYRLNPCWKDDRLFKVARQINIATATNIFMYELLPLLLGYDNMVHYNLISNRVHKLTAYYEDERPLVYTEFEVASRFFHTMIDGRIKRYDEHYHFIGEFPLSDSLYRQGLIETDTNFEEINRGTFYQQASRIDDIQDPEISEKFYGNLQRAHDLASIDIQRGRDLGVRGYNDYRHLCGMKPAKKFEDFADVMDMEKIHALKSLYGNIEDVDLLAGIISENFIKGTFTGPTLFCIMAKQLQLWRFSDRFWFERGDQLHSFNLGQLHEIRRTNIARLACDNAEAIKHIQPRAFLQISPGNQPVPCTHIYGADITKWTDPSCHKEHSHPEDNYSITHNYNNKKSASRTYYEKNNEPKNMVVDYSNFFDTLLSFNNSRFV